MEELLFDIRTATREQMQVAFQQTRAALAAECAQIAIDLASCNENRWPDNPIPFVFNFTDDVEEDRVANAEAFLRAKSK